MMHRIITVKTPPVIAKDAPRRRIMPAAADLEATLAAMKADAEECNRRMKGKMIYRPVKPPPKPPKPKAKTYNDLVREKNEAAILAVLQSALQDGVSTDQVAADCGLARESARANLRRMERKGMVTHTTSGIKARCIWFYVQAEVSP